MFIPPKNIRHHLLSFLKRSLWKLWQYLFSYVVLQQFLFHNKIYQLLVYCISPIMFHYDNNNLPQNQKLFHNMLKRLNDHLINSNINLFLYIHHYYIIHIKDFGLPQSVWRDRRMFYHQVFRRGKNTHMVHLLQQIRLLMPDLLFFVANLLQLIYSLHPNLNLAVL